MHQSKSQMDWRMTLRHEIIQSLHVKIGKIYLTLEVGKAFLITIRKNEGRRDFCFDSIKMNNFIAKKPQTKRKGK